MALNTTKINDKGATWGTEDIDPGAGDVQVAAYLGHGPQSTALLTRAFPEAVAPADRPDFDPTDAQWANFPGAAARANGYPRG